MNEDVRELKQIMREVMHDLAALLPNPNNSALDQWPVAGEADAACLSAAFQKLTDALGWSTYVADAAAAEAGLKSPQGDEVSAADQSASLTHKSTSGASNDT